MKRLAMLVLVVLAACNRQDNEPTPLLIGEWVWQGSSGGIAGTRFTPKPTERIVLQFETNNQFSLRQNDTLLIRGTFSLGNVRSIYSGKDESHISTQAVTISRNTSYPIVSSGVIQTLDASQLSIGDNNYDGYGSSFTRKP